MKRTALLFIGQPIAHSSGVENCCPEPHHFPCQCGVQRLMLMPCVWCPWSVCSHLPVCAPLRFAAHCHEGEGGGGLREEHQSERVAAARGGMAHGPQHQAGPFCAPVLNFRGS